MKLSVILPCFNGAATIGVQLDALTRQNWPEGSELIVVNNGSTDDSMAIVERYRGRLPGLRIVEAHVPGTPRLGVPHSYNTGMRAALGDAFVFCEADDEVAPGWLEAMGAALEAHDFVVARLDYCKLNAEPIWPPWEGGLGFQSERLRTVPWPSSYLAASACGFGLRRTLVETVGPLSTQFPIAHDAEYCCRAQAAGYRLHFEPRALIHFRLKPSARGRFAQARNWGRDTTRLQRHYGKLKRFAAARQLAWLGLQPLTVLSPLRVMLRHPMKGRQLLAEWQWQLGWSWGKLLASLPAAATAGQEPVPCGPPASSGDRTAA